MQRLVYEGVLKQEADVIRLYFGELPLEAVEGQEKWSRWGPAAAQGELTRTKEI